LERGVEEIPGGSQVAIPGLSLLQLQYIATSTSEKKNSAQNLGAHVMSPQPLPIDDESADPSSTRQGLNTEAPA